MVAVSWVILLDRKIDLFDNYSGVKYDIHNEYMNIGQWFIHKLNILSDHINKIHSTYINK